jgi:IS1 family transposase
MECSRCGSNKTLQRMLNRLARWNTEIFFADHWDAYAELIPPAPLIQINMSLLIVLCYFS